MIVGSEKRKHYTLDFEFQSSHITENHNNDALNQHNQSELEMYLRLL